MRPRNHLISMKLALLLIFAIAGGLFFVQGGLTTEAQLTPTPSMHVDIGSSADPASTGNTYIEDPFTTFVADDQLMSVPTPLTSLVSRTVTNFGDAGQIRIVTDIIIKNADEMAGADVRINFDPALIEFDSASLTPFPNPQDFVTGFSGQPVGLLNLACTGFFCSHPTASPAFSDDNTNGAIFLAGTYLGLRKFEVSSESGPTVDGASNSLPDRNAGQAPSGGVFVRINWDLLPASSGKCVLIDLTTGGGSFTGDGDITAGSQFLNLVTEFPSSSTQVVTLGSSDLFDGVVNVNNAPSPCPPPAPVHDMGVKHIGGTGASTLNVFKNCNSDPCEITQTHQMNVKNDSDHEEDIRVEYNVVGMPAVCTVNNVSGSPITVLDTVETGVNENASRNTTVSLTFSCPASEAGALTGTAVTFRLEVVHQRGGSDSQPDDDSANDVVTKGKILQ